MELQHNENRVFGRLLAAVGLVAMLAVTCPAFAGDTPQASGADAPTAIERVVSAQWMSLYKDGKFHPERYVTRAELASVLVKAFELDKRISTNRPDYAIPDVPSTLWAYPSIQMMLKTNTMLGYHQDERFYPFQPVNKAEGYAIIGQAYGVFQFEPDTLQEILAPYHDANKIPAWAVKAVATTINSNFVQYQTKDGTRWLHPLEPMTRADLAYSLNQYLDLKNQSSSPWKQP